MATVHVLPQPAEADSLGRNAAPAEVLAFPKGTKRLPDRLSLNIRVSVNRGAVMISVRKPK